MRDDYLVAVSLVCKQNPQPSTPNPKPAKKKTEIHTYNTHHPPLQIHIIIAHTQKNCKLNPQKRVQIHAYITQHPPIQIYHYYTHTKQIVIPTQQFSVEVWLGGVCMCMRVCACVCVCVCVCV